MRWVVALMFLSACDVVLGLDRRPVPEPGESTKNDEDGDEIVDAIDPCPHIPDTSEDDRDEDNIGDDCDPRPDAKDRRLFFALLGGDTGRLVPVNGVLMSGEPEGDANSIVLGAVASDFSELLLDLDSDRADVAIDVRVLGAGNAAELGVYAVHRSFQPDDTERGDNCLVGRDGGDPPNFLEMNLDDKDGPTERFAGALGGAAGVIRLNRTTEFLRCTFSSNLVNTATLNLAAAQRIELGDVALATARMRVQIFWVWVVVPQ